ncbi:hypothetical protein OKW41_004088 [Paraburkholderia sp. UCT70]
MRSPIRRTRALLEGFGLENASQSAPGCYIVERAFAS